MTDERRKLMLGISLATVYLVWGSSYLANKLGVAKMPPFLFGGVRFVIAGALLCALALYRGESLRINRRQFLQALLVGAFAVLISNGANVWALQWVPSNQAALLNTSSAFFIAALGTMGPRSHALHFQSLVGLLIGIVGTALILLPSGGLSDQYLPQMAIILLGSLGWSIAAILQRNFDTRMGLLSFTGWQMLLGGLLMLIVGSSSGELPHWQFSTQGMLALAYMIFFSACLGYTAFTWLARNAAPALVGSFAYVNPVIATLLGWWALGERLTTLEILGSIVVLIGVVLVTRRESA
ncbi:MAG: EamA family transporter [Steroidobacteraceae bacterium]